MTKNPKISVIMPTYNGKKYIKYAIESILNQTYEDFELIIVNDCSTDNTEEIILSFLDKR
ncbi:MAG: glycosyltransferase family 2 protein, partial [Flavobacteriales bacterium]|nr:glycosyltransferase family 2 protein [Flavobacteriales bacterium]